MNESKMTIPTANSRWMRDQFYCVNFWLLQISRRLKRMQWKMKNWKRFTYKGTWYELQEIRCKVPLHLWTMNFSILYDIHSSSIFLIFFSFFSFAAVVCDLRRATNIFRSFFYMLQSFSGVSGVVRFLLLLFLWMKRRTDATKRNEDLSFFFSLLLLLFKR